LQRDDGEIVYTRNGHFNKDNSGRVVSGDGYPIVPEIIIPPGAQDFHIGYDGTVTVKIGRETQELGQILLANFVNPAGLASNGGNNYAPSKASGDPVVGVPNQNGMGRLGQSQLESSNVNIVEEMVNMITGQRAYEINSKVIQTGDQMLQTTTNIR